MVRRNPGARSDSLLWGRTMSLWLSTNYRTELIRQSLRDKVPMRKLEQLWPTPPPPLPPQASLTDPPPGGDRRPAPQFARSRDPAAIRADQTGTDQTGTNQTGIATRLSAAEAARVLARLPAFPAPFTLPSTASDAWAVDGRFDRHRRSAAGRRPASELRLPRPLVSRPRLKPLGMCWSVPRRPGTPFLVLGHNGPIAWTFTTTGADTQDVYLEPPDVAFTTRQERIKVSGQPDTLLTVRETRHGPVISDLSPGNGPIMAVAMANLQPHDTGATGLLALNHARTVEEAGKAAPLITSPVQNLMVADRTKIGLFVTGRVPIRRAGDGWAPVPGTSDDRREAGPSLMSAETSARLRTGPARAGRYPASARARRHRANRLRSRRLRARPRRASPWRTNQPPRAGTTTPTAGSASPRATRCRISWRRPAAGW